jgi:hypothetical protein
MRVTRRDWMFIAVIGAVLAILLVNGFREKPKKIPDDAAHHPFLKALSQGNKREEVEQRCINCHNPRTAPLPRQHPPKEQCLLCHKW